MTEIDTALDECVFEVVTEPVYSRANELLGERTVLVPRFDSDELPGRAWRGLKQMHDHDHDHDRGDVGTALTLPEIVPADAVECGETVTLRELLERYGEGLRSVRDAARGVRELFESYADAAGFESAAAMADAAEKRRAAFREETGIYPRARLDAPDGGSFVLRDVYFWSQSLSRGTRNVDLREAQLPDVDLGACELTVFDDAGATVFSGVLRDEGNETLGDARCVVVEENGDD